jgi:hypothetical protein
MFPGLINRRCLRGVLVRMLEVVGGCFLAAAISSGLKADVDVVLL